MRVLVGYAPDGRGDDALALAALPARATSEVELTVANVHPPAWPTRGPASVDAEWVAYLRDQAQAALDKAGRRLAEHRIAKRRTHYVVHGHRGSGRGLIEVAGRSGADLVVIGSAPRGRSGRIAVGSTADQLLHGSPAPVVLAPRGYAAEAPRRFERMTIAYWRRRDAPAALAEAGRIAALLGVGVRLVTMVLRPSGLTRRFKGEQRIMDRQCDQAARDLDHAVRHLGGVDVETEVLRGHEVAAALGSAEWPPGELLVAMSSRGGPLRKVFVGDTLGKIVRAAPCPVVVLTRGLAARENT